MDYPDDQDSDGSSDDGDGGYGDGCCSVGGGDGDGSFADNGGGEDADGSADDTGDDTTGSTDYSAYALDACDGADQGDGSGMSWGSPDAATDSLASATGDMLSSAWHAAVDTNNLVGDAGTWAFEHLAQGVDGVLDNQQGLQNRHEWIQRTEAAIGGRWDNLMKDVGIRDGERDPEPEKRSGMWPS